MEIFIPSMTDTFIDIINVCQQIAFQLCMDAKDSDGCPSCDDFVDEIIIDQRVEANTGFTEMKTFSESTR